MSTETLIESNGYVYFTIEWEGDDFEYSANFTVHKVASWTMEKEICDTEPYLEGLVKWDGCSHITFAEDGYMHLCGKVAFDWHVAVMSGIWKKCSEKIVKFNHEVAEE